MALINFTDKVDLTVKNVPDENKIIASDLNSLKAGVNINEVGIASLVVGQTGGLISFVDKATMDAFVPSDLLGSYKVTNDATSSNNGYYHWTGSLPYVKDAELANGVIEVGNVDPVSGGTSFNAIDKVLGDNLTPYNSRMDNNTTVTSSTAGVFSVTLGSMTLETYENGVKINKTTSSNGIFSTLTLLDSDIGQTFNYRFYAKAVSGSNTVWLSAGESASTNPSSINLTLSSEWVLYEGSLIVGSSNRVGFIQTTGIGEIAIKEIKFLLNSDDFGISPAVEQLEIDVPKNTSYIASLDSDLYGDNLVDEDSRFNNNTTLVGTTAAGQWSFEAGSATMSYEDEGVRFDTLTTGTIRLANSTFIDSIPLSNIVNCQFKIKKISSSGTMYFDVTTSASGFIIPNSTEWQTINVKLEKTALFSNRVSFIITSSTVAQSFIIKDIIIADTEIVFGQISNLDTRIELIEKESGDFLSGKNLSIIGDSISTCIENNAVELTILASDIGGDVSGYVTQYDVDSVLTIGGYEVTTSDIGTFKTFTPVSGDIGKVIGKPLNYNSLVQSQLWWGILANHYKMNVLQNVSWSGSSVSSHNETNDIYKTAHAWHPAQITKCSSRDSSGVAVLPDVIILYRGTNDFSKSPYAKLTTFGADATSIPNTDVVDVTDFGYKEAISLTVIKLREAYPLAKIVLCTLNIFKRIIYDVFPTRNGSNTLPEFNNAIREVANQMGCGLIEFDKDGITFENAYPTYISDSATTPTHPNATGHFKMADKAIRDIIK